MLEDADRVTQKRTKTVAGLTGNDGRQNRKRERIRQMRGEEDNKREQAVLITVNISPLVIKIASSLGPPPPSHHHHHHYHHHHHHHHD